MALTPKQQRFVEEYTVDWNATQACIRAGYSARNADKIGPELLGKTSVAAAIAERQKRMSRKLEISAERVLKEYARLAFVDPRRLFTAGGSLKPIPELDDDTAAAVAGVDLAGEVKKVKLADKLRALEALGKHLNLFEQNNNEDDAPDNLVTLADALRGARADAAGVVDDGEGGDASD